MFINQWVVHNDCGIHAEVIKENGGDTYELYRYYDDGSLKSKNYIRKSVIFYIPFSPFPLMGDFSAYFCKIGYEHNYYQGGQIQSVNIYDNEGSLTLQSVSYYKSGTKKSFKSDNYYFEFDERESITHINCDIFCADFCEGVGNVDSISIICD